MTYKVNTVFLKYSPAIEFMFSTAYTSQSMNSMSCRVYFVVNLELKKSQRRPFKLNLGEITVQPLRNIER